MTIKISVYIAASIDGFIARKNGDLDWLPVGKEGHEDFGYAEFMSTVDHTSWAEIRLKKFSPSAAGLTIKK